MNKKQIQEEYRKVLKQIEDVRQKNKDLKAAEWSESDTTSFENLIVDAEKHEKQLEIAERAEALEAKSREIESRLIVPGSKEAEVVGDGKGAEGADQKAMDAFNRFLKGGLRVATDADLKAIAAGTSIKAYQSDNPAGGGFLVTPLQFVQELLANVKDQLWIRQMARTFQMDKSESLGVPTLDTDASDADWTSELATGSEDTAMSFGRRELKPTPVAKRVKLSNKLLRQAAMNPAEIVRDRLAYKFGVTEEKAFLTGTGAGQPLGVFTADANGITTARDTVAASATAIAADDMINAKHDLKAQYWDKAAWVFHRDVLKALRKLKDANNNYIWATGLGPGGGLQGNAPTILDLPYRVSEYAPNTFTTGKYLAVLGDFRYYWIVDALDMQMQVLDQLYAETNQTGYIARKETDGAPVLEEAFRRIKLA